MGIKESDAQARWKEFFDPLTQTPNQEPLPQREELKHEQLPSIFVQGKVLFYENGEYEVVSERVLCATVAITSYDGTAGGFNTEFIISPEH